jgi:hypothetical protein
MGKVLGKKGMTGSHRSVGATARLKQRQRGEVFIDGGFRRWPTAKSERPYSTSQPRGIEEG